MLLGNFVIHVDSNSEPKGKVRLEDVAREASMTMRLVWQKVSNCHVPI